jgi:hypothetical protein
MWASFLRVLRTPFFVRFVVKIEAAGERVQGTGRREKEQQSIAEDLKK